MVFKLVEKASPIRGSPIISFSVVSAKYKSSERYCLIFMAVRIVRFVIYDVRRKVFRDAGLSVIIRGAESGMK